MKALATIIAIVFITSTASVRVKEVYTPRADLDHGVEETTNDPVYPVGLEPVTEVQIPDGPIGLEPPIEEVIPEDIIVEDTTDRIAEGQTGLEQPIEEEIADLPPTGLEPPIEEEIAETIDGDFEAIICPDKV